MRPFAVQRRLVLLAVVAVAALLGAACDAGPDRPTTGARDAEVRSLRLDRGVVVDAYDTGATGRVDELVVDGDRIALLLSTKRYGSADTVVSSDDGGRAWRSTATGLGRLPTDQYGIATTGLVGSGDSLVAWRTVSDPTPPNGTCCGTLQRQEAALSDNGGRTWAALELPVPAGSTALIADAVEHDGTVLVVGSVQSPLAPGVLAPQSYDDSNSLYDASVWRRPAGSPTFERIPLPQLDTAPGRQQFDHVVRQGDRFVVIGGDTRLGERRYDVTEPSPVSFTSDNGSAWTELPGLPQGGPVVSGGDRTDARVGAIVAASRTSRVRLDKGAERWAVEPEVLEVVPGADGQPATEYPLDPTAARLDVDGGQVLTWVVESACDCQVATAGRAVDGRVAGTELRFDRCKDTSVRGQTIVGAPVAIGRAVVAPAGCNDRGRLSARLAITTDGGRRWRTESLRPLATVGDDLSVTSAGRGWRDGSVESDRLLLAAVATNPGSDAAQFGVGSESGRVVVLVVHGA